MLDSLAVVIDVPGEWLAILAAAIPIAIYLVRRRDAHASIVAKSEILAEKSVRNIEELWEKRDDLRDRIQANAVDIAYLKGLREGERKSGKTC
jgi:hypothetical protein